MQDKAEGPASVTVLMASYNGAAALAPQLESFAAQTLPPTRVLISDDGSRDATRAMVAEFAAAHPDLGVELLEGPCRGAARNFLHLLAQPVETDFVALSDQDDIWLPEKLAEAVRQLRALPGAEPALYCGRTWEVGEDLGKRRLSRGAPKPASFRHALVQNIAGGNTMVFNRAAAEELRLAALNTEDVVVHDWWAYQIMTGLGARVIFDDVPHMLYRQHAGNLIGANRGVAATLRRARMVASGRFREWCDINIAALHQSERLLTPEARQLLDAFEALRKAPPLERLRRIRNLGLYRQGLRGQISLYLAALLGRL
ncbi:MAG: glycosyltransferase family 2 protein [Paenirhodobacter sp.]|uniref:glycosyltransferase family 2 protein n=1 Tax=Paenirhodobacter sp. TaxID=1965326 RepID=UPI003D140C33